MPAPALSVPEVAGTVLFAMIGLGIAWSGELLQRNRICAASIAREALASEAHLASILDTIPEAEANPGGGTIF